MTPEDIAGNPYVARWFESAGYANDPEEERQSRLALLAEFCDYREQSPEELVDGLKRTTKDGLVAIAAKRRERMQADIEEFVAKRGHTGREAVVTGNTLRGFLVHNGIFIQGPVWRG